MEYDTQKLAAADQRHLWHPFTQMRDWCAAEHEPLILVSGDGAVLRDSDGREYIDGNSSIWTNLHGHNHPKINAAISAQLARVAHTSFLGFANPPAIELARQLVALARPDVLTRVFFSDNGSTAIEVAAKMAVQFFQLIGRPERKNFVAFADAYHGDTLGAASLGGVELFRERFAAHGFPVQRVRSIEELNNSQHSETVAAVAIEPLIQGAAGMRIWPRGMLTELRAWCDAKGALLICDEVMTGFGRTGTMFACQQENVVPDFLALAKGLTGGYVPLAATLTTDRIFEAFLGDASHTFYYGHSYAGNQLACAAALANLAIFRDEDVLATLQPKITQLQELLSVLSRHRNVGAVRQCGFIAGVDVVRADGIAFESALQTGARVCVAARKHGLLTRPIRDTVVLMPPYCITSGQLREAVGAIEQAIGEVGR
ncbi:MAG: adenosylmethionine---8-amino-7-oxononanoate aminotransferase [Chthoniobacter sp.]|jgi:adenosylmethionine-8-amino-7-oxononanoate aminotransferase|nr:adenosylmethionine---8-amino-7-oxononanoate aminotransferase [Chthoniobacter sp.]